MGLRGTFFARFAGRFSVGAYHITASIAVRYMPRSWLNSSARSASRRKSNGCLAPTVPLYYSIRSTVTTDRGNADVRQCQTGDQLSIALLRDYAGAAALTQRFLNDSCWAMHVIWCVRRCRSAATKLTASRRAANRSLASSLSSVRRRHRPLSTVAQGFEFSGVLE